MPNTNTANNAVDRVIDFLNDHDVASGRPTVLWASLDGTTLTVRTEEHHVELGWRDVEETIPATMRAARDWLGY